MTRTVAHFVDTSTFGGAEEALRHLLGSLDAARWRSVLLHHDAPGLTPLLDGALDAGAQLRTVAPMRGPRGAAAMPGFVRALRDIRPDVLHAHLNWPLGCSAGLLAASVAGVPSAATVQLFDALPRAATLPLQGRLVTRTVGRYIAVSGHVARRLERELGVPPDRLRIIHNAVPESAFRPPARDAALRARLVAGTDRPLVLSVARLEPQKDLVRLVHAAAELPEVMFAIAGEGSERASIEAEARRCGVGDRVALLGFRRDVAALLTAADVLVLPSLEEGLPLALLEAMAAGLPVIATRIGGTDELVRHERTGLLVPPADAVALAAAIRRLLGDPALAARLAGEAREHVRRDFSAQATAAAVMQIYDELADARGRRGTANRDANQGVGS